MVSCPLALVCPLGGAGTLDASKAITFEDVGNWYNTGGFEVIPWLELLDLRKW